MKADRTVEAKVAELRASLAISLDALRRDERIDLAGLDVAVDGLCRDVTRFGKDARKFLPELESLLAILDSLSDGLKRQNGAA